MSNCIIFDNMPRDLLSIAIIIVLVILIGLISIIIQKKVPKKKFSLAEKLTYNFIFIVASIMAIIGIMIFLELFIGNPSDSIFIIVFSLVHISLAVVIYSGSILMMRREGKIYTKIILCISILLLAFYIVGFVSYIY